MGLDFFPDLVITNRTLSLFNEAHNDETLKYLQKNNIPYVLDLDDYWRLGSTHPLREYYKQYRFPEQIIKSITHAAQVWATNEYLADRVRRLNPNVMVVPNAIDFTQPQFESVTRRNSDKVYIGWAGSTTHYHDIEMLRPSMKLLHSDKDMKGKYAMLLGGFHPGDPGMIHFENVFTAGGKAGTREYQRIPQTDVYNYGRAYEFMHISLCPLIDNEFNRCKSHLKALESGAKGCAVIASNVHPYNEILVHEHNALLVDPRDNERGWKHAIKRLVNDPQLRNWLASNLHKMVKDKYSINTINEIRINSINKLL